MAKNYNMNNQITCISKYFAKKEEEEKYIHIITNQEEYDSYKLECLKNHNKQPVLMEYYTNETPIKPFFDIDAKFDAKMKKKDIKDMDDLIRSKCRMIIQEKYTNKDIIVQNRPIRKTLNDETKLSYRLIVNNAITNVDTLKKLVEQIKKEEPLIGKYFDINPYRIGTNKLCMLGGVKPFDKNKDLSSDKPKPFKLWDNEDIQKYSVFDCAITYVKEDYDKYYDVHIVSKNENENMTEDEKQLGDIVINQATNDFENDDTDIQEQRKTEWFIKTFKNHLLALSNERSIEYNDWYLVICIIVNCYVKYKWTRDTLYDLAHSFSEKASDKYDYNSVEKKVSSALTSTRNEKVGFLRLIKMLKEDNPEYYNDNIVPGYYEKKQEFEEEFCVINNPLCFYRTPKIPRVITENSTLGEINQQLTKTELMVMRENLKYLKRKEDKKTKKIYYEKESFLTEWLKDEKRKTYEGLRFEPKGLTELESKYYKNLFTGFQADRIELTADVDYTRIQPILDHIKIVLCNNNEEHKNYVLNWFSRIIQDPTNRPQTGLVFYSKEHGVGKNIFTNYFANEILGYDLSVSAKNVDKIFGRFNSILAKCMFLIVEEASGELKKFMEEMKNMITEPTIVIEKKNIDSGTYRNFLNIILNTNKADVLDIDDKDRRFVVLCVSAIMKGNDTYYNKLNECMKNKQNTALFIKYLREEIKCDWTTADFQKYRPLTEAYKKQQALSAKNYIKFISHILTDEGISYYDTTKYKWTKYSGRLTVCIKQKEIWEQYLKMCEKYKYTSYPYDTFFANITDENTGIKKVISHKIKCIKIDKLQTEKWVEIFRNTENTNIEVYDDNLVEEWDEKTKTWVKLEQDDTDEVDFRSDTDDVDSATP